MTGSRNSIAFVTRDNFFSHWPFFIVPETLNSSRRIYYLRSETFKLTGVRAGRIKGDGNFEKEKSFLEKMLNNDSSKSSLNGLGINTSQFTAFRFYTRRI